MIKVSLLVALLLAIPFGGPSAEAAELGSDLYLYVKCYDLAIEKLVRAASARPPQPCTARWPDHNLEWDHHASLWDQQQFLSDLLQCVQRHPRSAEAYHDIHFDMIAQCTPNEVLELAQRRLLPSIIENCRAVVFPAVSKDHMDIREVIGNEAAIEAEREAVVDEPSVCNKSAICYVKKASARYREIADALT